MHIHFNLFNIILLFGTVQGLILSLMLLFNRKDKRQNRYFLAAFMLALAYNSFGTFAWSSGFDNSYLNFFDSLFPYTFIFTVGASFYLYVKTSIDTDRISHHTIFKTYLPALIDCGFRLLLLLYANLNNRRILPGIKAYEIDDVYRPIAQVLMVIVFCGYLLSAIRLFRNYKKQIVEAPSLIEQNIATKWTGALLVVMTLIALVWAATIFGSILFKITSLTYFAPIEIILVIFVFWIGLKGYQQTRVVYVSTQKAAKIYADNILPDEAEKCIKLLRKSMDTDKLYLDPELTVNN